MKRITKGTHQQYLASEWWQQRRKAIIQDKPWCTRCRLPRWVHRLIYGQDIHVHHKNYQRVGCELDSDLEVLCLRCHEIESLGRTDFPFPYHISDDILDRFLARKSETYMEGWNDGVEYLLYLNQNRKGNG